MKNIYLNSNVYKLINGDLQAGMLNHSYLLISNDKQKINSFAEFVCCTILAGGFENNTSLKILHNNHPDVKFYPQGNKGIVTEEINSITDDAYVLPMEGDKKIYVLKNFESATIQAQNKLLKTLEEPPHSVVFVITTTNENGVLPTIRSRCKKVVEGKVENGLLESYILNNHKIEKSDVEKIVGLSEGNITTANDYITNKNFLDMVSLSEEIFVDLKSSANVLELSAKMQKFKSNIEDFLNIMLNTIKKLLVNKVTNKGAVVYSNNVLVKISEVVLNAIKKVKSNCNINSVCDGVLMGILEVKFKCQK